ARDGFGRARGVAGAAAARGRQVRGRRLRRGVRAGAPVRGDHGRAPEPHRAPARRAAGQRARGRARRGTWRAARRGGRSAVSELLALGISHKTAPVALRERLAVSETEAGEFARQLSATPEVREAVVISTCNRSEV